MYSMQLLLQKSVIEARFTRRHPKLTWSNVRGAFLTTNWELLNSKSGRNTLNFNPPNGRGMGYDHRKYNLVVGWDIFRQEYRVFGVENSVILKIHDVSNDANRALFWLYFQDRIMQLTSKEKLIYMGYVGP